MGKKSSLGSNPLGTKQADPHLRHVIQGGATQGRPQRPGPVAVVLSGRGAEAAFEAGVVSGLAEKGMDAEILSGISLGALNAAVLAAHEGSLSDAAARLQRLWLDRLAGEAWTGRNGFYRSRGDVRSLMVPTRIPGALAELVGDSSHWLRDAVRHGARMVRAGDDLGPRLLWLADLSAMLSLDPLAELVREVVDLAAVRRSKRRLRIATADWVTGRLEVHDAAGLDGKAGQDRIVAAAARPGVFPGIEIDGRLQVEAAAFAASHLGAALDAGANELHVPIFLAGRAEDDRPASTIDALDRMLAEFQLARLQHEVAELRAHSKALTVHLYRGRLGPAQSHGFFDMRRERISRLIEDGRERAAHHDCGEAGCLVPSAPAA